MILCVIGWFIILCFIIGIEVWIYLASEKNLRVFLGVNFGILICFFLALIIVFAIDLIIIHCPTCG